jgi:radical SAM superfamily enzyme YgiQ (UPF0313 family)/intein/homing endonuclease
MLYWILMKIAIGYPPLESEKGIPLLGQNRQFQWAKTPWRAYPVVPAYAATLLKKAGYVVVWLDGIAEEKTYQEWEEDLRREKPDVLMMEMKTPVVKKHWEIIDKLKIKNEKLKIVLVGDHVTALPEESFQNSPVDYVLTGGDYDFLLLNLVNHLTKREKLEPGIYYRAENTSEVSPRQRRGPSTSEVKCSGKFQLNHDLDGLPFVDRKLTRWELYSEKNSNYSRTPGTYTMFGRDCWWGRCSFCVTGDTQILTQEGLVSIENIVEEKQNCEIFTAESRYKRVRNWHKRYIDEEIRIISALYLPYDLKITPNHKIYFFSKDSLRRCSKRSGWSYKCRRGMISKFLKCEKCPKKYYLNYKVEPTESGNLKKGDFLAIPIDRNVREIKQLNVEEILKRQPTILKTQKRVSCEIAKQIIKLNVKGKSERTISKTLNVDRETVHRYLLLAKNDILETSANRLSCNKDNEISFVGGHHKIPRFIDIDEDFLFTAGLYIAEGHVSYHKNRLNSATIGLTFNKNETEFINRTKLFFKRAFKIVLGETLNIKNNTCQLFAGSTIVCKIFKILFGDNCYEKKIPIEFMHLPTDKQRFLLSGIFKGDGHLREKRKTNGGGAEYVLETTSKMLANQVFMMLLRFNAIPSYKTIQPRLKNEAIKYKITLFGSDIYRIFPNIKFDDNSKITYKRGFVLDNFALVPIIKIGGKRFRGFVYNLTVEEDHSYTANFLTVKNCSWTTLYPGCDFRVMNPKRALDEIGYVTEKFSVREVMDDSGTFPVGEWLREFCEGMIKRGYNQKIKLDCNMRFNAGLSEEDYNLMGKAGFRFLLYGLESANQKTLDRINKNLKVEQIEKTARMAKKAGLWVHATAMVGYPWESKQNAQNTLNMAKDFFRRGLIDSLQATIVIPYPGTPLFRECQENNWLKTFDWDRYDMKESVMKTEMTNKEIMGMIQGIYSAFWNPRFVLKRLREGLTNWERFKYYAFMALKFASRKLDFRGKK